MLVTAALKLSTVNIETERKKERIACDENCGESTRWYLSDGIRYYFAEFADRTLNGNLRLLTSMYPSN